MPAAKSLHYCRWWPIAQMSQVFGHDDIEADKRTYQVLFSAWFTMVLSFTTTNGAQVSEQCFANTALKKHTYHHVQPDKVRGGLQEVEEKWDLRYSPSS